MCFSSRLSLGLAFVMSVGCGARETSLKAAEKPVVGVAASGAANASGDVLGARPTLVSPPSFVPPLPQAYRSRTGLQVWLLERHGLPIVSLQVVVPAGAATDPEGKGGLAFAVASMLDEGAGARGALEISRDIDRLGATLRTGAYADYAFAELTTLKKNLAPASAILGDVVAKPTFAAVEWRRFHDLWLNELRARASEPDAVAGVVASRVVFGNEPYGHPTDGTLKSADKVSLEDVKRFYGAAWAPERAIVVVAGDITRAELDPLLERVLVAWVPRAGSQGMTPPGAVVPNDTTAPRGDGQHVVLVDRPDAPQAILAVVRRGVAAADALAPLLARVNTALGGSFTSRLNQDLREEHGWSYGARSRFTFTKAPGLFSAQAAVHTEHTGDALKAMLNDMQGLVQGGLTQEELEKTRLIARGELVESFAGVQAAARRLARNAGVGLPPDHEQTASLVLDRATPEALKKAAALAIDPSNALIVIVGPRTKIEPQLRAIGINAIQTKGPEGE